MARQFLSEGWEEFRNIVIEHGVPADELFKYRIAFYAGCRHMFATVTDIFEATSPAPTFEETLQANDDLQAIQAEFDLYGEELEKAGKTD
jgi:hypothetical protein